MGNSVGKTDKSKNSNTDSQSNDKEKHQLLNSKNKKQMMSYTKLSKKEKSEQIIKIKQDTIDAAEKEKQEALEIEQKTKQEIDEARKKCADDMIKILKDINTLWKNNICDIDKEYHKLHATIMWYLCACDINTKKSVPLKNIFDSVYENGTYFHRHRKARDLYIMYEVIYTISHIMNFDVKIFSFDYVTELLVSVKAP